MSFSYYRCDWIHPESEEPVVIYYEVDAEGDVPRLIDVFADGRKRGMVGVCSLVEGSFYDGVAGLVDGVFFQDGQDRISLTLIDADKFEVEWQAHRPSSPSRPH
jgi:hypothetical protein